MTDPSSPVTTADATVEGDAQPVGVATDAIVLPDEDETGAVVVEQPNGNETEVTCPGCGLVALGDAPRPTAAWFCPRCDYPLFWATEAPEAATPASRASRRRLPGTNGVQVLAAEPCWHCGEMADLGASECGRCAATLPKPRAPHVQVPYGVPVPVPVVARAVSWPFVAAGSLGAAAVAVAITTWLGG